MKKLKYTLELVSKVDVSQHINDAYDGDEQASLVVAEQVFVDMLNDELVYRDFDVKLTTTLEES